MTCLIGFEMSMLLYFNFSLIWDLLLALGWCFGRLGAACIKSNEQGAMDVPRKFPVRGYWDLFNKYQQLQLTSDRSC